MLCSLYTPEKQSTWDPWTHKRVLLGDRQFCWMPVKIDEVYLTIWPNLRFKVLSEYHPRIIPQKQKVPNHMNLGKIENNKKRNEKHP